MKRALLTAMVLACSGCPKGKDAPSDDDRLIAKLKAAKELEDQQGANPGAQVAPPMNVMQENMDDPLTKVAADPPVAVKAWRLPATIDFPTKGLSWRLNGVETSQTISGNKLKLSTNEQFLKVDLKARAAVTTQIDLAGATLKAGEETFGLAPDAQKLRGTRDLAKAVNPDESAEVILIFELPDAAIAKGVTLQLPVTGGPPLEVPLQ